MELRVLLWLQAFSCPPEKRMTQELMSCLRITNSKLSSVHQKLALYLSKQPCMGNITLRKGNHLALSWGRCCKVCYKCSPSGFFQLSHFRVLMDSSTRFHEIHSHESHTLGMLCYGIPLGDVRSVVLQKNVFVEEVICTCHEGAVVPPRRTVTNKCHSNSIMALPTIFLLPLSWTWTSLLQTVKVRAFERASTLQGPVHMKFVWFYGSWVMRFSGGHENAWAQRSTRSSMMKAPLDFIEYSLKSIWT